MASFKYLFLLFLEKLGLGLFVFGEWGILYCHLRPLEGSGMAWPVCSVQCAVCSVQCVQRSVQFAVCSVQCAVCTVQCAVCSVQCAVCTVQCAQFWPGLRRFDEESWKDKMRFMGEMFKLYRSG